MKKALFLFLSFLLSNIIVYAQKNYPRAEGTSRFMSFNVRNGMGMDEVTDYMRTAKVIESLAPDVVAIQELDSVTQRSKGVDVLKKLADETKMYASYGWAIDYDGGKYGIGILSKQRPLRTERIPLPGWEEERALLIAEFENYVFCCTHLSLTADDSKASVAIIDKYAKQYKKPVILAGDFNSLPESETMKEFARNWKILSTAKEATYPASVPEERIDYILGYTKYSGENTYSVHQSKVVNEPEASDHRPIFVDVRLKTSASEVMRTAPYLQNPSTDGMTVMWLTNVPCRSWVEYGTDTLNMKRARSFTEGQMIADNTINRIRLEDLQPGTKYYYRAVSQEITMYRSYHKEFGDTVRTPISSFTTWDKSKNDFTAIIFNDVHDNYPLFDQLYGLVKDVPYDFVIFNGDCIDGPQNESAAVSSISYYSKGIGADHIPSIYMRGNHEIRNAYSIHLWDLLGKVGTDRSYGAFSYGNTRFVLLDCGEDKPDDHWVYYDMNDFTGFRQEQVGFLKKELASPEFKTAKKHILIHHIPIFHGKSKDKDLYDIYNPCLDLWGPVLAKAPFDVSLNAHTHHYEFIPKGEASNAKNNFPVVIGGGNKFESATVMILKRTGEKMSLKVLSAKGETLLSLDL